MGRLILLYGINGVGKDTIALELSKQYKNTIIVSDQRILMYYLGLLKNYKNNIKINTEKYKALESTPRETLKKIYKTKFLETIEKIRKEYEIVFLISHLVISLHINKNKPKYLDTEIINEKLSELLFCANSIVYIKSKPEEILERRIKDRKFTGRNRPIDLKDIKHHQKLNDKKWKELLNHVPQNKTVTVLNHNNNLNEAITQSQAFIDKIMI